MNKTEPERGMNEEAISKRNDIIRKIESIQHPLVLKKIEKVVDEADTYQKLIQYQTVLDILQAEEAEDHSVRTHADIPHDSALSRYDKKSVRPMFYISALTLVVMGALVTAITEDTLSPTFRQLIPFLGWTLGFLYLFFVADFLIMLYLKSQSSQKVNRQEFIFRTMALVLPPSRIGSRDLLTGRYVWIPYWHWSVVTEGLFTELKKRFILPMILIALLIVPVLVIEWKFMDEVKEQWPHLEIDLILEIIQTIIWTAFTFEFLLMISVTNEKLKYCKKNWIDLLIILLPFVSFLRTFRFSQIARLKYATRSFKLRGVMTKTRQGLIFLDFVRRIFRLKPESELRRIQKMLRENERDRRNLEQKLLETAEWLKNKK